MNNHNIVEENKKMLLLSGNLSDFQLNNMKTWSFIVFDNLEQVSVEYNFQGVDGTSLCAGSVTYIFKFKQGIKPEKYKHALDSLTLWTRYMFWADTQVLFEVDGEKWI